MYVSYLQWGENREALEQQSSKIIEALKAAVKVKSTSDPSPLGSEVMEKCFKQLTDSFDNQYGGFGGAPKFPQPGRPNVCRVIQSKETNESHCFFQSMKKLNGYIIVLEKRVW